MSGLPSEDRPRVGLRERKKAKTRAAIQHEALRLFREQGYEATTVEQIAEAVEVSPSTFFRYFPTKEDVVLTDEHDPPLIEAFRAQPPELTSVQALRGAMRAVFAGLTDEDLADMRERMELTRSVPELRAAWLGQLAEGMRMVAVLVAERVGRDPGDFAVRTLAGALLGVMISVMFQWAERPESDLIALLDAAMAHLESGLPL